MKKLLSLISALTLGTTSSLTVIACGNTNPTPNPDPSTPGTENTIKWSNQTSNIAKAIILGKNENFNTNKLLNNALNNNDHSIQLQGDESTGDNYENFKNTWGYANKIDGIAEGYFNSNSASTIDNNLNETKTQITSTLTELINTIRLLDIAKYSLTSNERTKKLLDSSPVRNAALDPLWSLKENPETIKTVEDLLPMIQNIFNNIGAFNAQATLGDYYKGESAKEIAESVLGDNGWLKNYQTNTNFSSEAVSEKSSVLNEKNFDSWDKVALFKSSVDLNGLIYQLSGNELTLGKIFNNAMTYDEAGNATNLDINQFIEQIGSIWSTTPESIINLVSTLIPIIKYTIFEIKPTTAITKISTNEKTDKNAGILNLTDIISTIEKIILTKDGFTNFITEIFFPSAKGKYNLSNYATLDFTINKQPLADIIFPIKSKIVESLNNFYTTIIEPIMKNAYVQDICNKIKEIIEQLTDKEHVTLNLTYISHLLSGAKDFVPFFEKLMTYTSKEELSNDWMSLWTTLGVQDDDPEVNPEDAFAENSFFSKLAAVLETDNEFIAHTNDLLKFANKIIPEVMDVLINKQPTTNLDFNNKSLWSVDESTVKFSYDETFDETTIAYNLTDKTKANQTLTYKVIVVVAGNADQELTTQKVWLKSLNLA